MVLRVMGYCECSNALKRRLNILFVAPDVAEGPTSSNVAFEGPEPIFVGIRNRDGGKAM